MKSKFVPLCAVLGCLVASLSLVGASQAAPFPADQVHFIQDWINNPVIQEQDKIYSLQSTDLDPASQVSFTTNAFPGLDVHTVVNFVVPTGLFHITYDVDIAPGGPGIRFETVSNDSDVPSIAPDVLVEKKVYDAAGSLLGTLDSLSGTPSAVLNVDALNLTHLHIVETFSVDQGVVAGQPGILSSATNTYTEVTAVPEPASMSIWGLLAATGMVAGWRNRRKATA